MISFPKACATTSPKDVFVHMRDLGRAGIDAQYHEAVKSAVEAGNIDNIKLLYAWWEINYGNVNIADRIPRIQSDVFRDAANKGDGDRALVDVLTKRMSTSTAVKTLQLACEATDPVMSMRIPRLIGSII
jgi:hypothetical protein